MAAKKTTTKKRTAKKKATKAPYKPLTKDQIRAGNCTQPEYRDYYRDKLERQKGGRPTSYTPEMGQYILERLMQGESLTSICSDDDLPYISTVQRWVKAGAEEGAREELAQFCVDYMYARQEWARVNAMKINDIADGIDGIPQWIQDLPEKDRLVALKAHISAGPQRDRLRIDARKWHGERQLPQEYGPVQRIQGDQEEPISVKVVFEGA